MSLDLPMEAPSSEYLTELEGKAAHPKAAVELATWIGLLSPEGGKSDFGRVLAWLRSRPSSKGQPPAPALGENLLLFWLLIRADALLPALLAEGAASPSSDSALSVTDALARLIRAAEQEADPDDLVPALPFRELMERLENDSDLRDQALEVRMAILKQLGLLRIDIEAPPQSWRRATPALAALASVCDELPLTRSGIEALLDRRFVSSLAKGLEADAWTRPSRDKTLLYLARAFKATHRELGFTPGRPLALLAAVLAAEESAILEISDVYECVYGAARSRWSPYLHFSGGSRFDSEFLIRLESGLEKQLLASVAAETASGGGP